MLDGDESESLMWILTQFAKKTVDAQYTFIHPQLVAKVREGVSTSGLANWELIITLESDDWQAKLFDKGAAWSLATMQ